MKLHHRQLFLTGAFAAVVLVSQTRAQLPTPVDIIPGGLTPADGANDASISASGGWVAFASRAADIVANDNNNDVDIFLRDRSNTNVVRVSVATGGAESHPALTQTTFPVTYVGQPSVSQNGRYVAFASSAPDLVPNDTNNRVDVFVRDTSLGTTERVSVSSGGTEGNQDSGTTYVQTTGFAGPHNYITPSGVTISRDGRYVLFASNATNLVGVSVLAQSVFLHDRTTGTTELISANTSGIGNGPSWFPSISADGRYVAFESMASDMIANDANGVTDVFVRDRTAGTTIRVSEATGGIEADGPSGVTFYTIPFCPDCGTQTVDQGSQISADGHVVVFASEATNMATIPAAPTPPHNVFWHDITSGVTTLVSANASNMGGDGASMDPACSSDGRFVAYQTEADDIVVVPMQSGTRILSNDHLLGTTTIVSLDSTGQSMFDSASGPTMSDSGAAVAFTDYTDLDPTDTNQNQDVYSVGPLAPSFTDACEGAVATCPCGNVGAPLAGCASSSQPLGALLQAIGAPSVSADTIVLQASRVVANTSALFAQSATAPTTATAPVFGDGVRCLSGTITRLATRQASGTSVQLGVPGDPKISVIGVLPQAGGTRFYEIFYRNAAPFCSLSTFNSSNSIRIVWTP